MCIISGEIDKVAKTKIFCALNKSKTRQITVYSNEVNSVVENNLMILPVPFIDTVQFLDLSTYPDFFKDCEKSFYKENVSFSCNMTNSFGSPNFKSLKVYNVGSYKVSIVEKISDFANLDPKYFHVTQQVVDYLAIHYYSNSIGFLVCKLDKGSKEYHPLAYSHKANPLKLFAPTRHYHVHNHVNDQVNDQYFDNINRPMFGSITSSQSINTEHDLIDDWDHDIYFYNGRFNKNKLSIAQNNTWNNKIKILYDKIDFNIDKNCKNFQKISIKGIGKNQDIFCDVL